MRHLVRVFAVVGAAGIVIWACGGKSPTEPTSPVACAFSVSPSSLSFGAAGGSASVTVTTAAQCAWTAASDRGWMTIGSAAGSGPGGVAVSVAANGNTASRSGTLTVAGTAIGVQQDGAAEPCTVAIAPASASLSKDAATGSFTVTTPAACAWTAVSGADWITVAAASGRGTAPVGYAVARNTGAASRQGAIAVADATFSIVQWGDGGLCEFRVTPVSMNACMAVPYELVAAVTTQAACPWTAATDAAWITLSGGASRVGPGEVHVRIGNNYDAPRLGVLKIRWDTPTAGQNVQISQAGCRYAVSAGSLAVPAAGGTFSFDVYQQSDPLECGGPLQNGCVWTATPAAPWISIASSMPQAGDGRVTFAVAPNAGAARTTTIAVRDKVVVIAQAGT